MPALYKLLRPHYLQYWRDAGELIFEGVDIPNGWVPTLSVDPLNTAAVNAFYAAGPRDGGIYEDTNLWPGGFPVIKPATSWHIIPGTPFWQAYWALSGLGVSLAPLPIPTIHPPPTFRLLLENGNFLQLENGYRLLLEQ
jgi:hypothetical protein